MKLKSTLYNLRQQPVITAVSIIGTALAIFLIMVIVMTNEVKVAPFAPESNRDRWLVNQFMSIGNNNWDGGGSSNGPVGPQTVEEVYRRMTTPDAVTVMRCEATSASVETPGKVPIIADWLSTDDQFWKVMDFTFVSGHSYEEADFKSGRPVAVITESLSHKLFGSDDPIGREMKINMVPYKVCGVVKDVSTLANMAYAQIWVPYTSTNDANFGWCSNIMGTFSVIILAKDKADFPAIREEFERLHKSFFETLKDDGWFYVQRGRPYDQETQSVAEGANLTPDLKGARSHRYVVFAVLLLVPAINLSSMTHSRLRRQRQEIGVRRAFGASRGRILTDTLIENMLITLVAGIIGLIASALFAILASEALFAPTFHRYSTTPVVDLGMLLDWRVFVSALVFCFILNLLSAGIPALQAARTNIVNALSNK